MSLPELPSNASRLELRKALIQMRLELHRQELRHETLLALKPLQEARDLSQQWRSALGRSTAPIWGAAALGVLALTVVRRKQVNQWLGLGSAIAPLLLQLLRSAKQKSRAEPSASNPASSSDA
jgi:hypothetical protein